jgi:hypothetical protein
MDTISLKPRSRHCWDSLQTITLSGLTRIAMKIRPNIMASGRRQMKHGLRTMSTESQPVQPAASDPKLTGGAISGHITQKQAPVLQLSELLPMPKPAALSSSTNTLIFGVRITAFLACNVYGGNCGGSWGTRCRRKHLASFGVLVFILYNVSAESRIWTKNRHSEVSWSARSERHTWGNAWTYVYH